MSRFVITTLALALTACPIGRPSEPKSPGDDPGPADDGKSTETGGDPDPDAKPAV